MTDNITKSFQNMNITVDYNIFNTSASKSCLQGTHYSNKCLYDVLCVTHLNHFKSVYIWLGIVTLILFITLIILNHTLFKNNYNKFNEITKDTLFFILSAYFLLSIMILYFIW